MNFLPVIFKVVDKTNNKNFIFIGDFDDIRPAVNKSNNTSFASLDKKEQELISRYVGLSNINNRSVFVKCLLNYDDTIDVVKKKICVFLKKKYNSLFLWCSRSGLDTYETQTLKSLPDIQKLCEQKTVDCTGRKIKSHHYTLGFEYMEDGKPKLVNCELENIKKQDNFVFNMKDTSYKLLKTAGTIQKNIIYLYDFDRLSENIDNVSLLENIRDIYFPFLKRNNIDIGDYDDIVKNISKKENELHNILLPAEQPPVEQISYSNIVFTGRQIDTDISEIFNRIVLDDVVCFCKFKYSQKKEIYKILKAGSEELVVKKNFSDAERYIVGLDPDRYLYPIPRSLMEQWSQKNLSVKEKFMKNIDEDLGIQKSENELTLKLKYKDSYLDVVISRNNVILRLLEPDVSLDDTKKIIRFVNSVFEKISKKTNQKFIKLEHTNIITLDYSETVNDSKINFLKVVSAANGFNDFVYSVTPDNPEKNKLYLNYKKIDDFTSPENIKRFYVKIKNETKLSISEFKKVWVSETKRLFGLSETDALRTLINISETLDADDLKTKPMDLEISIVVSHNFNEKKESVYDIKISNCNNFFILQNIKHFLYGVFELSKKRRKKEKKVETPQFEIKETVIDNEDDFELDDDFIDLEDFDDEENTENIGNIGNTATNKNIENIGNIGNNDNSNDTSDVETPDIEEIKMKNMSVRNYMSEMRKKDNKLFNFKNKDLKPYTKSCGAVDMKQPIIITRDELNNFQKKTLKGLKA